MKRCRSDRSGVGPSPQNFGVKFKEGFFPKNTFNKKKKALGGGGGGPLPKHFPIPLVGNKNYRIVTT